MHCAAMFMPFAASHCAMVWKAQFAIPEMSLRQTGEPCPRAAGAAMSAARRLDEAISVLMRDLLDAAPPVRKTNGSLLSFPKQSKPAGREHLASRSASIVAPERPDFRRASLF